MKCLEQIPFISTPYPEVQGTDDRLYQCPERACFISTLKMKLPNRPNRKLLQIKLPSRPSRKRVNALNGLVPFPQMQNFQSEKARNSSVNALNGLVPFPLKYVLLMGLYLHVSMPWTGLFHFRDSWQSTHSVVLWKCQCPERACSISAWIAIFIFVIVAFGCQCPERACSISAYMGACRFEWQEVGVNALNGLVPFPLIWDLILLYG